MAEPGVGQHAQGVGRPCYRLRMGHNELTELVENLVKSNPAFTYLHEMNDEIHFEDDTGRFWCIKVEYRGSRSTGANGLIP